MATTGKCSSTWPFSSCGNGLNRISGSPNTRVIALPMRIVRERTSITEKTGLVESIENFLEFLLDAVLQMGVRREFPIQNCDVMVNCLWSGVRRLIT